MWTNVQFKGTLNGGQSHRWYTWGWPAQWHVVWYMMPTTPRNGAPQIEWDVEVERGDATHCTYWLTVKNVSAAPADFEARYAVLS
ncbi:MAG: hypothetical protein ACR2HP_16640 [Ilumatobacteraceae bacterium]